MSFLHITLEASIAGKCHVSIRYVKASATPSRIFGPNYQKDNRKKTIEARSVENREMTPSVQRDQTISSSVETGSDVYARHHAQ